MVLHSCEWCGNSFAPRTNGGKPQRFCSQRCRRALDSALRAWAQEQHARGRVTVAELQGAGSEEGGQGAGAYPTLVETAPRGLDERARCPEGQQTQGKGEG